MDWDNIALPVVDYYIAAVTETARIPVMGLADSLRRKGYSVETDLEDRSLKAQLRSANRTGTSRVLIIGDDELTDGTLQVKDFSTGDQETVDMESFLKKLKVRQ
jgi:histidyl-tRNA synthetase